MKKFFINYREVLGTLALFALLLVPAIVAADGSGGCQAGTLCNPLGGINSFCKLASALVKAATIIGIPIAVLFIVWAGLKFVLAQGKPADLAAAQKNLMYTLVGIGIFVAASVIAAVIVNTLQGLGVQGINTC